jgi:hypothetical protein
MARTETQPMSDAERADEQWKPMHLVVLGLVTLVVSLSIIVFLGSRVEGCAYVDGSRPGPTLLR